MPLFSERLQGWTSIADTFVSFFGNQPGAFWLDREHHPTSRFSIIGVGVDTDSLDQLAESDDFEFPFAFRPGLVGVIHYSSVAGDISNASLLAVDRAFVYDHDTRQVYFLGQFASREEFNRWYHAALLRLALIGGEASAYELNNPAATSAELKSEDDENRYLDNIAKAQQHIVAGDVYQLCLTTRLRGDYSGDPLSYFLRLRRQHPAPYSAFIRTKNRTFVSISPELFLQVHGERVISAPIKGTRKRGATAEQDLELMNQLGVDPKERAENLMIVDLIRNDLARVCLPESVAVESLLAVRSYSTVHQLVSEVSGQFLPAKSGIDALASLFPGGSMTGAPKIRAMEIIQQLEQSERAGYSGALGWIAPNGDMELSMVIRTAIFESHEVSIGIGGGITADSRPAAEHEEIKLKAAALADVLGAAVAW